jgi:hypothetical protein
MPTYSMKNTETDETFEIILKYSDLEIYLNDNPNIKQIFTRFPGTVDPVNVGIRKTDEGFRDALREVKNSHRKNTINV